MFITNAAIFCTLLTSSFCRSMTTDCHRMCTCTSTTANCSGHNLTYVPRFPKSVRIVDIRNTNLGNISINGLLNLTFNHITRLKLVNNSITHIHALAFQNITYLTRLEISRQSTLDVENVKHILQNMRTIHLQELELTYNGWNWLPRDMFESLFKSKMKAIDLQGNVIKHVDGRIFALIPQLKRIYLNNNRLETINTTGLQQIFHLDLSSNQLRFVPKWCSRNSSNVLNLWTLRLDYNLIGKLDNLECLPQVFSLSIQNNLVESIPPYAFTDLPQLQNLNLNALGNPIKRVERHAFSLRLLKKLTISNCKINFRSMTPSFLKNFFLNIPNLEVLNIQNNILPDTGPSVHFLLRPLSNIKQLHMDSCRIYELPVKTFSSFKHLEELFLNLNRIQGWENGIDIFGNSTSIKYLDISGNHINFINYSSIPENMLSSLEKVNLAHNPFYCTCDQKWFADWLRSTNVNVVKYPKNYRCAQPVKMRNRQLKDYKPTEDDCKPLDPLLIIIISIASFGIFLISGFSIILKCQNNIRNYLYLIRVTGYRKLGYLPITGSDNFEYHAFVVYCDADSYWVHNKLIRKLEGEESMRLCIHHRDFEVGETISGNIDNFLQKSWKVVVVMSNDFAKSEWCQWEVDIVQERRRRYGRDVFLLIMLKDITSRYMTSPLCMLLDSTPYLKYQQGIGEDLFWKAAVEGLRKSIDNPPVSVFT